MSARVQSITPATTPVPTRPTQQALLRRNDSCAQASHPPHQKHRGLCPAKTSTRENRKQLPPLPGVEDADQTDPQPHGIAQHAEVSRQGFKSRPEEARQRTADRPGRPTSCQLLADCTAWVHAAPACGGASGRRRGEPAQPPEAIQDPHG